MKIYNAHPAALAFPPLKGEAMAELKKSLLERGQIHPAVLIDGKLLDGRNRQEALRQLIAEKKLPPSTELKTVEWSGRGGSAVGFADATNDKRRHLTESQRAMIATRLLPMFRKEAKERQLAASKSPKKKQKTLKLEARAPQASDLAAKAAGGKVSGRLVRSAEFIRLKNPDLAKKVFEGEMSVKQAERKIRIRDRISEVKEYKLPEGIFDVICADPAWQYDDELNGSINRALPYPTQPTEEICELDVASRAAEHCALFLCVTKTHLLNGDGARVCKAWGFEPKSLITWAKANIGLGRYVRNRCEFVIIATKGSPPFDLEGDSRLKDDLFVVHDQRLENSEKPDELFTRIEAICPGKHRLELNARKKVRAGWTVSGSELAPAAPIVESDSARPARDQSLGVAAPPAAAPSLSNSGGAGSVEEVVAGAAADPAHAANDAAPEEFDTVPLPDPASVAPVPADEIPF